MSSFEALISGRTLDAIESFTCEIARRPSAPAYANRAIAYLEMGQTELAQVDLERANEIDYSSKHGRSDVYLNRIGCVEWVAGDHVRAARTWASTLELLVKDEIQYSDAAGGVGTALLSWFGATRVEDEKSVSLALRFIRKNVATRRIWPAALGRFVLGDLQYAEIVGQAIADEGLLPRRWCQAEFYAAAITHEKVGVAEDVSEEARERLESALKFGTRSILEIEYFLAKSSLTKLGRR